MSVCMNDIELCMQHADRYDWLRYDSEDDRDDDDDQGKIYDVEDHQNVIVRRLATLFPRLLETLVLWDRPGDDIAEQIRQGLVKMIQSGRYENLKAILLEATEKPSEGCSPRSEKSWFQWVVKADENSGVDVYTLYNQEAMRHSIKFAEAPDECDLTSGIHAGVRSGDWIFDPYLGRRIPPCSKAEQYAALWKRLKSEFEAFWAAQKMEYAD